MKNKVQVWYRPTWYSIIVFFLQDDTIWSGSAVKVQVFLDGQKLDQVKIAK